VTLFASIFFFVNTFPTPPPTVENQFTAGLTYGGVGGTTVTLVQVSHLAGPPVPGSDLVYITSAAHPAKNPPAFTVSSGLGNAPTWTLGQQWTKDISTYGLTIPDNLTVSIVSASELLFRTTLPGSNPNIPPTFVNLGFSPTAPQVGQAITIYTQIVDNNLKASSPTVNISQLPGSSGTGRFPLTFSASSGLWSYTVAPGVTTAAGSFYVFVNATDLTGLTNSAALQVTIVSASAPITVSLVASPSTVVVGTGVTLLATIANLASNSATVTVTFTANAATLVTTNGAVGAGSTATFTTSWTPATVGVYALVASASVSGGLSASSALNVTAYPSILLLAHNVPAGTMNPDNTSAWLAAELTADGIPFNSSFVSCSTGLTSSLFTSYGVAVVDFGSTWVGSCPKSASTTDENAITGATSTSFFVVGSNAFGVTPCASYQSGFFSFLGAKWTSGSTCTTLPNATGSATYAASAGSGLRGDGIPATITINRSLANIAKNVPYTTFNLGANPNTGYLTVSAKVVGTFKTTGSVRGAALASEPALMAAQLPNGQTWGTGAGGAAIVYNVMNYLCGLSSSTTTGRALTDFGVAETALVGTNHAQLTKVYAAIRANGPVGASVSATLFVNGTVALLGGVPVTATGVVAASGGFVFVTLSWEAPSSGFYTLSVLLTPIGPTDLYVANDQVGFSVINQATNFA